MDFMCKLLPPVGRLINYSAFDHLRGPYSGMLLPRTIIRAVKTSNRTHFWFTRTREMAVSITSLLQPYFTYPQGALGYLGGCIRSLSKLKNTPKALISGQKSTLILIKHTFFPLNKDPFLYQNTDIG